MTQEIDNQDLILHHFIRAGEDKSFQIIWKGSPNFWPGRDGEDVQAICNHIMQGSLLGTDGYFKNPINEVSSHFGVGKTGLIYQWVLLQDTAWANGIPKGPDRSIAWIDNFLKRNQNLNRGTVSIEHEGNTGEKMPEAQYQASLWLHKVILSKFDLPINRETIIGHFQIDKVTRANCPGSGFQWDRLRGDLAAWDKAGRPGFSQTPNPPGSPSPVPFDPNPQRFNVGQGVQWALSQLREKAATNEQWYKPEDNQPGLGKVSFCWGNGGHMLVSWQKLDDNGNPTGAWETHAFSEVAIPND